MPAKKTWTKEQLDKIAKAIAELPPAERQYQRDEALEQLRSAILAARRNDVAAGEISKLLNDYGIKAGTMRIAQLARDVEHEPPPKLRKPRSAAKGKAAHSSVQQTRAAPVDTAVTSRAGNAGFMPTPDLLDV